MFKECSAGNYNIVIDKNKSLQEQSITYEAKVIMAVLKYNCWLNQEDKLKMQEILNQNTLKDSQPFNKSDVDEIFSSKFNKKVDYTEISNVSESYLPAKVENKSWFVKLFDRIKSFFKNNVR